MILLSSTAFNIFWLGRYLSRVQQACSLLPFDDDQRAVEYAHTFCLPAWDANSLNALFLDPTQPFSIAAQFAQVRNNIQQLRSTLTPKAYSELNVLTKSFDEKVAHICQVVYECSEVLEGEMEQVFLFYSLGRLIEDIDHACRNESVNEVQLEEVDRTLEMLAVYGWQSSQKIWLAFRNEQTMENLYQFGDELARLFEECE